MSSFDVLGGDFLPGEGNVVLGTMRLHTKKRRFMGEAIHVSEIDKFQFGEIVHSKSLGKTLTAGLVGGAVLGGVGALAGMLTAGDRQEVTFAFSLKDGRILYGRGVPSVVIRFRDAAREVIPPMQQKETEQS